jgi:hypothetical protein
MKRFTGNQESGQLKLVKPSPEACITFSRTPFASCVEREKQRTQNKILLLLSFSDFSDQINISQVYSFHSAPHPLLFITLSTSS